MRYVFGIDRFIYDYIMDQYLEIVRRYELNTIPPELASVFRDYYEACCEVALNLGSIADMYETACSYVGEWSAEEDYLLAEKLRRMDPMHPFIRELECILDSLHETPGGINLEEVLPDLFCHMLNGNTMREIQRVVRAKISIPEDSIEEHIQLHLNSHAIVVNTKTPLRH